jgi:hypothetical protein
MEEKPIPYNHQICEFNPYIVDLFAKNYLKSGDKAWEPFAGHFSPNKTIDICAKYGVNLYSFDIAPIDSRVVKADSTITKLNCKIQGAIFHPPYLGSSPMSNENGELSKLSTEQYWNGLKNTVKLIDESMDHGFVCIVGRILFARQPDKGHFRQPSQKIQLDWMFTELFVELGFGMKEIYNSPPDWVIVLEK